MKHKALVEGDVNLLEDNEILITHSEGYTILRERLPGGNLKTSVIVPLEEFKAEKKTTKKASKPKEETNN